MESLHTLMATVLDKILVVASGLRNPWSAQSRVRRRRLRATEKAGLQAVWPVRPYCMSCWCGKRAEWQGPGYGPDQGQEVDASVLVGLPGRM